MTVVIVSGPHRMKTHLGQFLLQRWQTQNGCRVVWGRSRLWSVVCAVYVVQLYMWPPRHRPSQTRLSHPAQPDLCQLKCSPTSSQL